MISETMPSTDRQARGRRILFQRRARLRAKPMPPIYRAELPRGKMLAVTWSIAALGFVAAIAITSFASDPPRRSPVNSAREDGGSALSLAPRRGAADLLPKIDDRVPQ